MKRSAVVAAALMMFGCAGGSTDSPEAKWGQAALSTRVSPVEAVATKAWTSYADFSLTFEMQRDTAVHHLDITATRQPSDLSRAAGASYTDGPDVNGRGTLAEHVITDGPRASTLDDASPAIWIDLLYCPTSLQSPDCENARSTSVQFEASDIAGNVRARYQATLKDGTVVTGTFITPERPTKAENDFSPTL